MTEAARILVVDDEEIVRDSFSIVLKNAGYAVETAENGREAIRKAETEFYNLALIDIRLPDMEGTELLTAMKQTTPKMVKIIVTGYPSLHNAVEAVNKGADGYIIKPVRMEELLNIIREDLRKQQESRRYDEEKLKEFVETRIRELDTQEKCTTNAQYAA